MTTSNPYDLLLEAVQKKDKELVVQQVVKINWDQHKASSEFDTVGLVFKLFLFPIQRTTKTFSTSAFICVFSMAGSLILSPISMIFVETGPIDGRFVILLLNLRHTQNL